MSPRALHAQIADEGVLRALRFAVNVLTRPTARRRVRSMRRTFGRHRDNLLAVAIIAHKDDSSIDETPPLDGDIDTKG
ncbi:hypothetical protein [Nocardia sp. CNY236]|uniref:hypothetical protein n=1 Tax=Nocardia sp. CNY236 TaxID=1169152 RepID=UPI0012DFD87A